MDTKISNQTDELLQIGTFTLESQFFGVDILRMREIIRPVDITKVPQAEQCMEGVINLRGTVIPVISLRARFGMPRKPFDKETRIINMEIGNTIVGFIVDSIGHVQRVPAGSIEPAPPVILSVESEYILGITRVNDELFTVLDMDKLVAGDTLRNFAQEPH
ncbi:chemotaxis protein CheW [Desulfovibrio sp. OttesenSCG-928-F20]|nr:chemotaxis protein CheW [Desulfovibrio sp. OttesenSCG-928-F20]